MYRQTASGPPDQKDTPARQLPRSRDPTPLGGAVPSNGRHSTPKNRSTVGIPPQKIVLKSQGQMGGTKIRINGGFRRFSGHDHVALRTFASRNPLHHARQVRKTHPAHVMHLALDDARAVGRHHHQRHGRAITASRVNRQRRPLRRGSDVPARQAADAPPRDLQDPRSTARGWRVPGQPPG